MRIRVFLATFVLASAVSLVPASVAHAHPPALGFVAYGEVHGLLENGSWFVRLTFTPCNGFRTVTEEMWSTWSVPNEFPILSPPDITRSFTAKFEILEPAVTSGCVWDFQDTVFRFVGVDRYFFEIGATGDGHAAGVGAMTGEWAPFWLGDFVLMSV